MRRKHGAFKELQGWQPGWSVQESMLRNEGEQRPDRDGSHILASEM